nr:translation initiation factor IF-2-like [Desmodus rotundus]
MATQLGHVCGKRRLAGPEPSLGHDSLLGPARGSAPNPSCRGARGNPATGGPGGRARARGTELPWLGRRPWAHFLSSQPPITKNGRGRKQGARQRPQGEKREPWSLHLGEASWQAGERERRSRANSAAARRWVRQPAVSPRPIRRARPRVPGTHPSPSRPRPLPAGPRSTHARSSSRLRGSSRIGSQPRGRRRRRGRGERAARPPPPGPSPPPLRSCPAGPEPCLAGGPSPSGRGSSSPRPQRPQRRHRNCRFLLVPSPS